MVLLGLGQVRSLASAAWSGWGASNRHAPIGRPSIVLPEIEAGQGVS